MNVSPATLGTHLDYSAWSSARLLEAAGGLTEEELSRDLKVSHQSVIGTLAHVFGADRIWFDRIHGRVRQGLFDPGEDLSLRALGELWPAVSRNWNEWAAALDDSSVQSTASYRTLDGTPYESPLWQIVLHVVNHASYHRGQVSAMLRQLGRVPPATDLIAYYRK